MIIGVVYFGTKYQIIYLYRRLRYGRPKRSHNPPNPEERFDVFISYKSDHSEDIRLLAEALIAHGLRVWFDEYQINPFSRPKFESMIDHGIDRSAYFVFFDGPDYAASEYCQHELIRAKSRPDLWPHNALRIVDPSTSELPEGLSVDSDVSTFVASTNYTYSNVLNKTLGELGDRLGKSMIVANREAYMLGPDARIELSSEKHKATLIAPNWTKLNPSRKGDGIVRPITLIHRHPRFKIQCNIRLARLGPKDGHVYSNERDKIEAAISLIADKNRRWMWEIIGIHPLLIRGRSHLAATVDTNTDSMMHRYYMLFIGREKSEQDLEDIYVYFDFYFRGKKSDFFHMAYAFDDLVYASSWEKQKRPKRRKGKRFWRH